MIPEIPNKLYFKIGEVAKLANVPPHVLRYWESEFTAIKPKRANSGQRLYKRADVEKVLHIKVLLHDQGFTIAGAKKLLKSGKTLEQQPGRRAFRPFLKKLKKELASLQKLVDSTR